MPLCDLDLYLGETQSGRIVKRESQAMISYQPLRSKDDFLRGAAAMVVYFSEFGCLSGQKYGEPFGWPVCIRDFEKPLRLEN